jgi:hypothetical protein
MSVIDNVGTIPSSINTGPRRDKALGAYVTCQGIAEPLRERLVITPLSVGVVRT